jgi:hypothetical protein
MRSGALVATATAAVAGLVLVGCAGSSAKDPGVPVVVSGSASTWTAVTVSAEGRSVDVSPEARSNLTPLLATRALGRPAALSEYGLDRPQAELTYRGRSGGSAVVQIGNVNFDRHFFYAQRRGRATVYLVAADTLRPALALVGIETKPPD